MENNNQFPTEEKKNNSKALLYTIIGILVAINIGLGYMLYKGNKQKDEISKELGTEKKENQDLTADLQEAETLLEKYRADSMELAKENKSLNSELIAKKNYIVQITQKLRNNEKLSADELAKYRQTIQELNAQIAKLQEENTQLVAINERVQKERDEEIRRNEDLSGKNQKLTQQNNKMAQRLVASGIRIEPRADRAILSGDKEMNKAKKVDYFTIDFKLEENRQTEPGEKTLYVRIVGPDGITIQNPGQERTAELNEGGDVKYTHSFTKFYDGATVSCNSKWTPQNKLKPGTYKAIVYCDGFQIGATSDIVLK